MPTIVTGQTTYDHPANYVKIDVFDRIATYDPDATPLLAVLTRLAKKAGRDVVVRWFEDELVPRWGLTSATTNAVTADTTIDMATTADADVFEPGTNAAGTLAYVPATAEQLLVTSVSAAILTASRGYGDSSTAATIPVDSSILAIGKIDTEFNLSSTPNLTQPVEKTNVMQIFKDPLTFSGSEIEVEKWVTNDRDYKLKKLGRDHAVGIERSLWFASKKTATANTDARTMDGITRIITTNVKSITAALTQDNLDEALTLMARHTEGKNRNVWIFGSGTFVRAINKFARSQIRTVSGTENPFGIRYAEYNGPHFSANIVTHWLFEASGLATDEKALERDAYILNMDFLMYRPLGKRDTNLEMNIQENDRDGEKHQYLTEATIQTMLERAHSKITSTVDFI